jgi:hypothetical protein
MSYESERRLLQVLLGSLGLTAAAAGLVAVITGPEGQLGGERVGASIESEYRFYAALWFAYGIAALAVVPRVERATAAVCVLAGALFAAGLARALAWIEAGRPHDLYLVLLALELSIPQLLVLWQRRVRARAGDRRHGKSDTG